MDAVVVFVVVVEVLEAIVLVVAVPNLNKLLLAATGFVRLPKPGSLSVGRAVAFVGVGVALTAGDIPRLIVKGAAFGVGAESTTAAGFETDSTVVVVVVVAAVTVGFTDAV